MSPASNPALVRIFLAVFPPRAAQALAAGVIESLRRPGDGVSWVRPDNLHYTLRFIGDVGADGAKRIAAAADEAAAAHPAFDVALGVAGAFPNPRKARVLWLGLARGAEPFAALAASLEGCLAKRGFAPEGKRFTAHLTLGRVREPSRDWTDALASAGAGGDAAARFRVEAISVVESQLNPRGSIYTVRHSARLGAAG